MDIKQKTRTGKVISHKMDKTVIVGIETMKRHPLYKKSIRTVVRYKAHDEKNECNEDDTVRIIETRPISKEKHWRVIEILNKKEKVEVKPQEIV
jgi:small subunit ribosomal protein S17